MNRDTQFLGFASLLIPEIDQVIGDVTEWGVAQDDASEEDIARELKIRWLALIAQRAGEFAAHVAAFLPEREMHMMRLGMLSPRQVVDHVPDMIEPLPEESK